MSKFLLHFFILFILAFSLSYARIVIYNQEENSDIQYHYSLNLNSNYFEFKDQTHNIDSYARLFAPFWQKSGHLLYTVLGYGYNIQKDQSAELALGYRKYFNSVDIITGIYGYYVGRSLDTGSLGQGKVGLEFWYSNIFIGGHYDFPVYEALAQDVASKDSLAPVFKDIENDPNYKQLYLAKLRTFQYNIARSMNGGSLTVGYDSKIGLSFYSTVYEKSAYSIYELPKSYFGGRAEAVLDVRRLLAIHTPISSNIHVGYGYDDKQKGTILIGIDLGLDLDGNNVYDNNSYTHMTFLPYVKNSINIIKNSGTYQDTIKEDPLLTDGHATFVRQVFKESDFYDDKADIYQIGTDTIHFDHELLLKDNKTICGSICSVAIDGEYYKVPFIKKRDDTPTLGFSGNGIHLGKNNSIQGVNLDVSHSSKSVYYDNPNAGMGDVTLFKISTNGRMWFETSSGSLYMEEVTIKSSGTSTGLTMEQEAKSTLSNFKDMMVGDISIVASGEKLKVKLKSITINPDDESHDNSGIILTGSLEVSDLSVSELNIHNTNGTQVCGLCSTADIESLSINTIKVWGNTQNIYGIYNKGTLKNTAISTLEVDNQFASGTTFTSMALVNEGSIDKITIQSLKASGSRDIDRVIFNAATGSITRASLSNITGNFKYFIYNEGLIYAKDNVSGIKVTGTLSYITNAVYNTGRLTSSGTNKAIDFGAKVSGPAGTHPIDNNGIQEDTDPNIEFK